MTTLAEMQRDFQDYLLGGSEMITTSIHADGVLPVPARLGIYRFAYGQRLVEALTNEFPGLQALLGETAFATLARRYLAAHPSRHPSLRALGQALAAFLASTDAPHPLARDMAAFDWAVARAFDARDEIPIVLAEILTLPAETWEMLRLTFAESVSFFAGAAGIGDLRRALLRGEPADPVAGDRTVSWLVWRQDDQVQFRPVTHAEAASFGLMQNGGTFGAMCEKLAQNLPQHEEPVLRAATYLKDWVERGLVVGVDHDLPVSTF